MVERDKRYHELLDEANGSGTSWRTGEGPIYALRLAGLRQVENELAALRYANEPTIEQNRKRLGDLNQQRKGVIDRAAMIESSNSLVARITALKKLTVENTRVAVMNWLVVSS